MHDQLVDAAARVVEPKRRKVRKLAVALGNSVVELVAGRYVKAVNRIWGTKVGEYLSAPDARRHLWHACFAPGHPSFRWQTAAARIRDPPGRNGLKADDWPRDARPIERR